ncbi:MAG: hypothetical protein LV480_04110 [Methylacidiphilales bacterium]|nr:hypothetical protein [Candidatus Methylacidiphilales bacterium]
MARFRFPLSSRSGVLGWSAAGFICLAVLGATALRADPSMVPPPEKAPPPTANPAPQTVATPTVAPQAASQPAAMQAKAVAATPPVPDTFNRYGRIWAPSDDVEHPLKPSAHFPAIGEIRIPSQDELNDRDKLEQLAMLSDAEIRAQLEQWPPYSKMKLGDQGLMLSHIQQFKDQRTKVAMDKAHELGILDSMTPDQKARFEKAYWDKRREIDHDEVKQIEPILKIWEQKLNEDLFRQFSSETMGPVAQVPKPAAPAPVKTAASASSTLNGSPAQPMMQTPH